MKQNGASLMKILALEFSSEQRSAAVLDAARPASQSIDTDTGSMAALELVERALQKANVQREDIECIAVGLGPGSYTGIRSAIALAQGWQLARDVKLLGLGSVECLAAQAQAAGLRGRIHIVIDAHRNEFYHAPCDVTNERVSYPKPLGLATRPEIESLIAAGATVIGPEVSRCFARPDGLRGDLFPGAETLARLAAVWSGFVSGEKLEPIYLRETNFVKAPPLRNLPTS
jgi:tRNA threonylcarbamoyl adenosine modification protein YeaZ